MTLYELLKTLRISRPEIDKMYHTEQELFIRPETQHPCYPPVGKVIDIHHNDTRNIWEIICRT